MIFFSSCNVCLFIYCFTSRSRIFHLHGDATIAGERLQNLGLCSALSAFDHGVSGIFTVPAVTQDLGFSGLIRRAAPIQSPLTTHKEGLLNGPRFSVVKISDFKSPFTLKEMGIFFSIYTFMCALN
jgi:hypothetical protein